MCDLFNALLNLVWIRNVPTGPWLECLIPRWWHHLGGGAQLEEMWHWSLWRLPWVTVIYLLPFLEGTGWKYSCATGCCHQKWCLWNVSWNTGNNSSLWVVCHGYLAPEWKAVTHTSVFCWELYIWIYQDIDIYLLFLMVSNKFIFSCGIVFHFIKWVWKCPVFCSLSLRKVWEATTLSSLLFFTLIF